MYALIPCEKSYKQRTDVLSYVCVKLIVASKRHLPPLPL